MRPSARVIVRVAAAAAWLLGLAALPTGGAQASLIGDIIGGVLEGPALAPGINQWDASGSTSTATPVLVEVGAGVEFSIVPAIIVADFGANSLSISFLNQSGQAADLGDNLLFDFTGLDLPGSILNVLLASSDLSGVTFGFGDHSIHVEIPLQTIFPGIATVTFDILAGRVGGGVAVPEPGMLALFGLGCAGLAAARRRHG